MGTGFGCVVKNLEDYNWSTLLTNVVDFINKILNIILLTTNNAGVDHSNTFINVPDGIPLDRNFRIILVFFGTLVLYSNSIKSIIRKLTLRMKKSNTGNVDATAGWSPHVTISP